MPLLSIAHRGGAKLAPENTLAAFANARARGAEGAELDVHLSRDGLVVVAHDFCLHPDLTRDETGRWLECPTPRIRDLTLAELRSFDVGRPRPGSDYSRKHPQLIPSDGEHIPLLADVVELARASPTPFWLFVELKTSLADPSLAAPPAELADAAVAVLRRAGYLDLSILIGFDWRALRRAKAMEPSLQCWYSTRPESWFAAGSPPLSDDPAPKPALEMLRHWARTGTSPWADGFDAINYGGSIRRAIKAAGGDGWFSFARDATERAIKEAHGLGLRVGAWTVDEPAEMQTLAAAGIDAICSDRPDLLERSIR